MFTPIGFYAETNVLPPLVDSATVFYSANQNTDWTDLSPNGYNGTESTIGSGGTSAITHVAGGQPYWHFTCPSPMSEQSWLDTGYTINSSLGGTYTMFSIVKFDSVATNFQGIWNADDTGTANQQLTLNQNVTPIFFSVDRGLNSGNNKILIASTAPNTSDWFFLMTVADGSGITFYINNTSEATSGTSTAAGLNQSLRIGRTFSIASNYENKGKIGACGFFAGTALDATQRTELYDYYNAIYSF